MNKLLFSAIVGLLLGLGPKQCVGQSPSGDVAVERTAIEMTIIRHFQSLGGFQDGDLITRSQIEEIQDYLRRTTRHSAASHPRMLNFVLPDDCRLSRLFYAKNGAGVLRKAVEKLGSYQELEYLTKMTVEYPLLVKAIDSKDVDAIVALALERRKQIQKVESEDKKKRQITRIYTMDDFLTTLSKFTKAKAKAGEVSR